MRVGIIGGSGYVGGELLRLLLFHPKVELSAIVSREYAGEYVYRVHPNLRSLTQLKFIPLEINRISDNCDIVFTATPHGTSLKIVPELLKLGMKVIDMSADFRLKNPEDYVEWYGWTHTNPELLKEAVYGLPELHREEIKNARLVACPGCMSTSAILGLAPPIKAGIIENDRIVIDAKIGSSGAGSKPSMSTHHAERFGVIRPYKPVGHRHIAEIEQELNLLTSNKVKIAFSAHAVNIVRGILATIHTFLKKDLTIPDVWKIYRSNFQGEPFIRLVRDQKGLYKYPDPKVVIGSNFCDIGFELDAHANRLVIMSAIDNMMKGASGQGIQCLNIMLGIDEKTGLNIPSAHPI
jgi:N-acetyl-gamma-glutamyl-phosphate/LysW-gamma-L-alpha-aminoadipyl-6-phosphate reductase